MLGQFKGELGIDHHIVNVANETMSGLEPRWWLEKLIEVTEAEGRVAGSAFADPLGDLADPGDYDVTFRKYLLKFQETSTLILKDSDVSTMFPQLNQALPTCQLQRYLLSSYVT